MVQLTPVAITKVKEILTQQTPSPTGLRVAVVGGGCSGFSYHMAFESAVNENSDSVYEFDGLKVLVDQMSEMYLDGVQIDYIETIEGSGFKFNNPNVKSTCGAAAAPSASNRAGRSSRAHVFFHACADSMKADPVVQIQTLRLPERKILREFFCAR